MAPEGSGIDRYGWAKTLRKHAESGERKQVKGKKAHTKSARKRQGTRGSVRISQCAASAHLSVPSRSTSIVDGCDGTGGRDPSV